MRKNIFLLIGMILITGCATLQDLNKSSFAKKAETLGIIEADVQAVDRQSNTYYHDYQRTASQQYGLNEQMLQTQINAQMNKLNNIFCACVKKLGDKCQANPAGMNNTDKDLWVKGNGAAEAISLIQRSRVDPLACAS